MEKFFKPQISKNALANNNIDNNIYNSNNIYNKGEFDSLEYYMLSNLIISEATKKYYIDYNSTSIPHSYIGFYYKEMCKYLNAFTPNLKSFMQQFSSKTNNLKDAIRIFQKTFSTDVSIKTIKRQTLFNSLKPGDYLECSKQFLEKKVTYPNINNTNLKQAINNINQIAIKIDQTSYDRNLKYLYIDFLSTLENATEPAEISTNKKQSTKKASIVEPPKQPKQERVSNIKIPRLNIGRVFPTSFTHSRIDSAYFVNKFLEGYKAFALVEKYQFKKVKYSLGFETKRKALFETKKSDFDLF